MIWYTKAYKQNLPAQVAGTLNHRHTSWRVTQWPLGFPMLLGNTASTANMSTVYTGCPTRSHCCCSCSSKYLIWCSLMVLQDRQLLKVMIISLCPSFSWDVNEVRVIGWSLSSQVALWNSTASSVHDSKDATMRLHHCCTSQRCAEAPKGCCKCSSLCMTLMRTLRWDAPAWSETICTPAKQMFKM